MFTLTAGNALVIRSRRFLTLCFTLAQLTVLAGGPAVDVILHVSERGVDGSAHVTTLAAPDWSCGYCLLQATPGALVPPGTVAPFATTMHSASVLFHSGVLHSSSTRAAYGARAPPTG